MDKHAELHKGHREEPFGQSFEATVKVTPVIHYCGSEGTQPAQLHLRIECGKESLTLNVGDVSWRSDSIEESKAKWRIMAEYVARFLGNAQIYAMLILAEEAGKLSELPRDRISVIWEAIEKGILRGMDLSKMELTDEIRAALGEKPDIEAYIDFFTMLLIQAEVTRSRLAGEAEPILEPGEPHAGFVDTFINIAIEKMAQSQKEAEKPKRFNREWFNETWSQVRKVFTTPQNVYRYVPKTRNDELRERYHDRCEELRNSR